jgi:uncharacterized protein YbcI
MPDDAQQLTLDLSTEMIHLYKQVLGRGPARAVTHFAGADIVVCTLHGTLTPAEKTLRDLGEHPQLRMIRQILQHAHEQDFREAAERVLGRRVHAFVSGIDITTDVSNEVFHLEPQSGPHQLAAAARR